jgi:hypothetical protein
MEWPLDKRTEAAARNFPLRISAQQPVPQDLGRKFVHDNWAKHLRPQDTFLSKPSKDGRSTPDRIIEEFRAGHYLPALVLIVSWGTMWRTNRGIYQHSLQEIHEKLEQCAKSILETRSIHDPWCLLTVDLEWSNVMTSKTLHFLCRALDITNDPPVAIDGKVILERVWPRFRDGIPAGQRPQNWKGNTFAAYCRYMTAILTWAHMKNWTTTQIECTLYKEYK